MGMYHMHEGSDCAAPGAHLGNTQANSHTHDDTFSNQRRLQSAAHPIPGQIVSTGNTECMPCIAGVSFSSSADAPDCTWVKTCETGTYETSPATASSDKVCGACTNAPANAEYTTRGGTTSDCKFECKSGFHTANDGTECLQSKTSAITFQSQSPEKDGKIHMFENGILQFKNFKCVDAPQFCGGMNLKDMNTKLSQVDDEVKAIQGWAKSINAWAKGQGFSE